VYLAQPGQVRVGYAVGRRAGCAVDRNRLRRRLREAVRVIEAGDDLAPGAYLISPAPKTSMLPHNEMVGTLRNAMNKAQAGAPAQWSEE
jgi:ribonuclease P protein component